jgi:hypothetical protein
MTPYLALALLVLIGLCLVTYCCARIIGAARSLDAMIQARDATIRALEGDLLKGARRVRVEPAQEMLRLYCEAREPLTQQQERALLWTLAGLLGVAKDPERS